MGVVDASNINHPQFAANGGYMAKKNDMAVAPVKSEFPLIDETLLKSRIYTIRGVKVMLDAEKAGSAGMTLDEINAEIAAARSGK